MQRLSATWDSVRPASRIRKGLRCLCLWACQRCSVGPRFRRFFVVRSLTHSGFFFQAAVRFYTLNRAEGHASEA
jgi:hypothetical protein